MFLYKEKQLLKSEKWASKALKEILVSYNSYIIYWIYIKEQKIVIKINDFWNFENYKSKNAINLPDYNNGILLF